jgi:hypothetical protein
MGHTEVTVDDIKTVIKMWYIQWIVGLKI